ncbi:MAG: polyphenol oxidase family protein [Myxococcota bacterium]
MLDRSPLLSQIPGLVHGFSDREGGVSEGRYASLNLGAKWGDGPAAVRENHRRLASAAGYDEAALRRVVQVHGATVLPSAESGGEADGLWCRRSEACVVSIMTADCVPILLADRDGRFAAAVHSGWRGTVANIAGEAVAGLVREGARAGSLVAAIGPCIEQAAFEVGEEVAAQFEPRFVMRRDGAKPHVDLVATVRAQLVAAGLPPEAVDRVGGCTHTHPERWFSYRRDGAGIGQMLSFAGYPTPA